MGTLLHTGFDIRELEGLIKSLGLAAGESEFGSPTRTHKIAQHDEILLWFLFSKDFKRFRGVLGVTQKTIWIHINRLGRTAVVEN